MPRSIFTSAMIPGPVGAGSGNSGVSGLAGGGGFGARMPMFDKPVLRMLTTPAIRAFLLALREFRAYAASLGIPRHPLRSFMDPLITPMIPRFLRMQGISWDEAAWVLPAAGVEGPMFVEVPGVEPVPAVPFSGPTVGEVFTSTAVDAMPSAPEKSVPQEDTKQQRD